MTSAKRHIPAEWETHSATLLCYPHSGADWPGKFGAIQWAFIEIIRKVAEHEPVLVLVQSETLQEKVIARLKQAHANLAVIDFLIQKTNRSWMRDSGPIIVKREDGSREALHFGFNGWAKYPNHHLDQNVPEKVATKLNLPLTRVEYQGKHVVLEGGAIDVNGKGTLITTEECLLHPHIQVRNPGFSRKDYESVFKTWLGIEKVIWLEEGIDGDDTHGHVDDICRFVNADTVIACTESNTRDPNHRKLTRNLELLSAARLEDERSLNIIEIPMPGRIDFSDMRLPASYVNFLITNNSVLMPTFNDKNDAQALSIIKNAFPNHTITGIHATDLIWGLGTLHCLSREIPS